MGIVVDIMIYAGIALMVVNIIGYIRYSRYIQKQGIWNGNALLLYLPTNLLVLFLLGYIGVQLMNRDDLLVASILFGGSIFVFAALWLLETVTRKIETNEKLKADLEADEMANTSKTVFLSSMSHDIRTPLNAIIGYTNLMKQGKISDEDRDKYLDSIESSGKQLQELIDDVLEMSRIESGKLQLDEEPDDIVSMMEDLHNLFAVQMQEKNMTFDVDSSKITHRYAVCDRTLISRVLLNLISNAYKYTEEGGRIKVTACEAGKESDKNIYEFRVSDNGIGMTKEFAAKMFDAFEREQTSTISGIQGTGLGMAITKNIVDLMDGDINVLTSPGQGTEITFTVSLQPCEKSDVKVDSVNDDREVVDFSGMNILLVDDVEVNREIATLILEDMGFVVDTAVDGQSAFDKVKESQPGQYGAVLMDIQMPVMNGYEATKLIRSLDDPYLSNIPVIALTANAFEEDKHLAEEAGMNGHISKPINQNEMISTLKRIIKKEN